MRGHGRAGDARQRGDFRRHVAGADLSRVERDEENAVGVEPGVHLLEVL